MTSFPVCTQHEARWTQAESSAQSIETSMRTASVVSGTLIQVLTGVIISSQERAFYSLAAAGIAPWQIAASILTRSMTISQ